MNVVLKLLLILFGIVTVCSAVPTILQEWTSFKEKHGKSYQNDKEERFRLGVYLTNKQMIDEHNAKYDAGSVSYRLKINHFGDMHHEEVSAMLNGFNSSAMPVRTRSPPPSTRQNFMDEIPPEFDWRTKGAVTPVKDQGRCGACWAFSATGSLEGINFVRIQKLIPLSEQNLLDCSNVWGNNGCQGGLMANAFEYIYENLGIDSEESYPYEGAVGTCRFKRSAVAATTMAYFQLPVRNETALQEAVATVGPVSAAINARLQSFIFYAGGVYDDPACDENLNHAVVVVGYGTENGQDYWLVKNSWNTHWGEDGYVKIARNKGNLCGIATMTGYPVEY